LIKVLNVISDTNIGGAGNVLINFMKNTDNTAFVHTVALPENAELTPILRGLGVETEEVKEIADRSASLAGIGRFRSLFERLQPDIVHTHASLSARIAARQWGKCAVVHTRHCAYPQGFAKKLFPVKQVLGLINNRLSDIIIAVSPAARDNLTDTGADPRKIVTMFNGVPPTRKLTEDEKASVRAALGIGDGEFVCAVVARLVPEKGHRYILDAAELLRDMPMCFVIAGAGQCEGQLRADAEKRGLSRCIFTGFVKDVAKILGITDLQLNASYGTETSSLSLLEGMSLGIPSVATDYGGNPCLVTDGENGLIVAQRDGKAIAKAIQAIYEDPEMRTLMGKSALELYNERFTVDIMTAGIEQVYRDAVAKRVGRYKDG
jgi:glycosyltransferase involved in cell wall biosynthesis